ncbi:MAG TPA: hypothetical protein VHF00_02220 [Acidimicrobiales bacterium]|nr:hypothetical protein [Acidimicrobiales bacterium]
MSSRRLLLALVPGLLLVVACGGGDDEEAVTLPTALAPTTTVGTGGAPVGTGGNPRFPTEWTDYRHGDTAFGVYLAVERTRTAPELARAKEELRRAGYSVPQGVTDISCDQGAREALGLAPDVDYVAVVVYFRTEQAAQQFVDAFQPGVVGTAPVKIFCRDSGY